MNSKVKNLIYLCLLLFVCACSAITADEKKASTPSDQFKAYWYQGKAELTSYKLDQARYGEIHAGDAVLIFVTEDFMKYEQVKKEFGNSKNYASVLKLNAIRKFFTGIYPYSTMVSVFTPVNLQNGAKTIKMTCSNQEWCGQTFTQMNLRGRNYTVQLRSYFQDEADQDFKIRSAFPEDEVWTRIRISPESLPIGDIEMIPGLLFARFRHNKSKVEKASAGLTDLMDLSLSENSLQVYSLEYKNIKRKLTITFEKDFPHAIVAWEETQPSGFGINAKSLTTRAVRSHSIFTDYWTKNAVADSTYRIQLGLD